MLEIEELSNRLQNNEDDDKDFEVPKGLGFDLVLHALIKGDEKKACLLAQSKAAHWDLK
jgi:hypothetical protein